MKNCLLAIGALLFLTSCAGVHVKKTYVASGATNPQAIYIRPFDVTYARVAGRHGDGDERPALKEEMEKIAPAMIINDDEIPKTGWLVEGEFEVVHAGSPRLRKLVGHLGPGRSHVLIHVRISDMSGTKEMSVESDAKGIARADVVEKTRGNVIYEFDLAGGSRLTGPAGSVHAPGLGYATPFDFRNAAERVMMALSPDPHRYGVRTSPGIR
jgi:hypothetical protein